VQESAAGRTLPCPACGAPFVVQPLPRAADDFLPPTIDLAAGGPIAPATRVLEPVVYPRREIPWTLFAIGTGLCLVLGLILLGGWQAYKVVSALVEQSSSESGALATGDLGAGAVADVADQASADAAAAVAGAGKVIDRLAGAVSSSIELPKILTDTHERLADERARLKADYQKIREAFAAGQKADAARNLADLKLRTEDLAIRWFLLAPMTDAQRERLLPRLKDELQTGFGGNPIGEPDRAFDSDPEAGALAQKINEAERMLVIAASMAAVPSTPQGLVEEKLAEAAAAGRELCRQLYSVRSVADMDRVLPALQAQIAKMKDAAGAAGQSGGAGVDVTDAATLQRLAGLMIQISMAKYVGDHVNARLGKLASEGDASAVAGRLAGLMTEYETAQTASLTAAMGGQAPAGAAVVASVAPQGAPGFSVPDFGAPGVGRARFGLPPGFGPGFGPAGFGPPGGFGGPPAGFGGPGGVGGPPSTGNIDADFEDRRQAFAQANGADQILTVRASGGTEAQFKALEATIMRLVRPRGHSMNRVGERFQLCVLFAGEVERVAGSITVGKVTGTDAVARMITVEFKP
jgi:hypothetical protein